MDTWLIWVAVFSVGAIAGPLPQFQFGEAQQEAFEQQEADVEGLLENFQNNQGSGFPSNFHGLNNARVHFPGAFINQGAFAGFSGLNQGAPAGFSGLNQGAPVGFGVHNQGAPVGFGGHNQGFFTGLNGGSSVEFVRTAHPSLTGGFSSLEELGLSSGFGADGELGGGTNAESVVGTSNQNDAFEASTTNTGGSGIQNFGNGGFQTPATANQAFSGLPFNPSASSLTGQNFVTNSNNFVNSGFGVPGFGNGFSPVSFNPGHPIAGAFPFGFGNQQVGFNPGFFQQGGFVPNVVPPQQTRVILHSVPVVVGLVNGTHGNVVPHNQAQQQTFVNSQNLNQAGGNFFSTTGINQNANFRQNIPEVGATNAGGGVDLNSAQQNAGTNFVSGIGLNDNFNTNIAKLGAPVSIPNQGNAASSASVSQTGNVRSSNSVTQTGNSKISASVSQTGNTKSSTSESQTGNSRGSASASQTGSTSNSASGSLSVKAISSTSASHGGNAKTSASNSHSGNFKSSPSASHTGNAKSFASTSNKVTAQSSTSVQADALPNPIALISDPGTSQPQVVNRAGFAAVKDTFRPNLIPSKVEVKQVTSFDRPSIVLSNTATVGDTSKDTFQTPSTFTHTSPHTSSSSTAVPHSPATIVADGVAALLENANLQIGQSSHTQAVPTSTKNALSNKVSIQIEQSSHSQLAPASTQNALSVPATLASFAALGTPSIARVPATAKVIASANQGSLSGTPPTPILNTAAPEITTLRPQLLPTTIQTTRAPITSEAVTTARSFDTRTQINTASQSKTSITEMLVLPVTSINSANTQTSSLVGLNTARQGTPIGNVMRIGDPVSIVPNVVQAKVETFMNMDQSQFQQNSKGNQGNIKITSQGQSQASTKGNSQVKGQSQAIAQGASQGIVNVPSSQQPSFSKTSSGTLLALGDNISKHLISSTRNTPNFSITQNSALGDQSKTTTSPQTSIIQEPARATIPQLAVQPTHAIDKSQISTGLTSKVSPASISQSGTSTRVSQVTEDIKVGVHALDTIKTVTPTANFPQITPNAAQQSVQQTTPNGAITNFPQSPPSAVVQNFPQTTSSAVVQNFSPTTPSPAAQNLPQATSSAAAQSFLQTTPSTVTQHFTHTTPRTPPQSSLFVITPSQTQTFFSNTHNQQAAGGTSQISRQNLGGSSGVSTVNRGTSGIIPATGHNVLRPKAVIILDPSLLRTPIQNQQSLSDSISSIRSSPVANTFSSTTNVSKRLGQLSTGNVETSAHTSTQHTSVDPNLTRLVAATATESSISQSAKSTLQIGDTVLNTRELQGNSGIQVDSLSTIGSKGAITTQLPAEISQSPNTQSTSSQIKPATGNLINQLQSQTAATSPQKVDLASDNKAKASNGIVVGQSALVSPHSSISSESPPVVSSTSTSSSSSSHQINQNSNLNAASASLSTHSSSSSAIASNPLSNVGIISFGSNGSPRVEQQTGAPVGQQVNEPSTIAFSIGQQAIIIGATSPGQHLSTQALGSFSAGPQSVSGTSNPNQITSNIVSAFSSAGKQSKGLNETPALTGQQVSTSAGMSTIVRNNAESNGVTTSSHGQQQQLNDSQSSSSVSSTLNTSPAVEESAVAGGHKVSSQDNLSKSDITVSTLQMKSLSSSSHGNTEPVITKQGEVDLHSSKINDEISNLTNPNNVVLAIPLALLSQSSAKSVNHSVGRDFTGPSNIFNGFTFTTDPQEVLRLVNNVKISVTGNQGRIKSFSSLGTNSNTRSSVSQNLQRSEPQQKQGSSGTTSSLHSPAASSVPTRFQETQNQPIDSNVGSTNIGSPVAANNRQPLSITINKNTPGNGRERVVSVVSPSGSLTFLPETSAAFSRALGFGVPLPPPNVPAMTAKQSVGSPKDTATAPKNQNRSKLGNVLKRESPHLS